MSERNLRDVDELLKKAYLPWQIALKYHSFYKGKIQVLPKCPIRNLDDLAIWYTPGVAEPCKKISENLEKVYEFTNRWNTVAVVTDGSRVLGLGDIGPEASYPVMEGKALLFKYLGGVDAFPICLATKNSDEIISVVKVIKPSFGGINLEDISQPKCFYILERLRNEMDIPVWHDDQQGTATVVLAGLTNALKLVGKKIDEALIAMVGAGAANISVARIIIAAGVKPGNIVMLDSKGILHPNRKDLMGTYREKWELCLKTNKEGRIGGIKEALKGADVCIAISRPGPGIITKNMVKTMNDDAIVFACANPVPEIWPWEALEAGARVVATGRSDFPNQINNSLGFPGIFRGTLDVRAKTITDGMCIAAAKELASLAEEKGLREDYILPTMDDWEVFPREAMAVGQKAIEEGMARLKLSGEEIYANAKTLIEGVRKSIGLMMEHSIILKPPEE
ncbi:MAG: NADP-dependent malic enzyme [Candidatus Bathyarchaeia archaeon]